MPTKTVGVLSVKNKLVRKNFHDNRHLGGYFIVADFDGNDIKITYRPHRACIIRGKENSITLKFEESNKLGFIIYSFCDDEYKKDGFINALNGRMNPAIYHYIKGAYHKHENHLASEDSLLQPFVSNSPVSFGNNEQEIVDFYLQQYKDKFEDFIIYNRAEAVAAKRQINRLLNINKGINSLGHIIEKGNTIKGEHEYFEFLHKYASRKGWISKKFRMEVKNHIDEINILLKDVTLSYNLCTTGLGIKYGRWGIFLGVAGIFVSAAGIFFPAYKNNHSCEKTDRKQEITNENGSAHKDSLPFFRTGHPDFGIPVKWKD